MKKLIYLFGLLIIASCFNISKTNALELNLSPEIELIDQIGYDFKDDLDDLIYFMNENYSDFDFFITIYSPSNENYYTRVNFFLINPTFVSTYDNFNTFNVKFNFIDTGTQYRFQTPNLWLNQTPKTLHPYFNYEFSWQSGGYFPSTGFTYLKTLISNFINSDFETNDLQNSTLTGSNILPFYIQKNDLSSNKYSWIYHSSSDIQLDYNLYKNNSGIDCLSLYDWNMCFNSFPTITNIIKQKEFFEKQKEIEEQNQDIDDYINCDDLECINEKNENVLTQFENITTLWNDKTKYFFNNLPYAMRSSILFIINSLCVLLVLKVGGYK